MYPKLSALSATYTPTELHSAKRALNDYTRTTITDQPPCLSAETILQYRQVLGMTSDPLLNGAQATALLLRVLKEVLADASQAPLLSDLVGIMEAHAVFKCVLRAVLEDDYGELEERLARPPREQSEQHVKTLQRRTNVDTLKQPKQYHNNVTHTDTVKKVVFTLSIAAVAAALEHYCDDRDIALILTVWIHYLYRFHLI